jgi:hypothetical protein
VFLYRDHQTYNVFVFKIMIVFNTSLISLFDILKKLEETNLYEKCNNVWIILFSETDLEIRN